MRKKEEILNDGKRVELLLLEVLLDIRQLLQETKRQKRSEGKSK